MIIETGTGIVNADSYVSVADFRTFATSRGITLPADNAVVSVSLVKAADYLESFAGRWKGYRSTATQGLSWPRTGVSIPGWLVTPVGIPSPVVRAQMLLAVDIGEGVNFLPTDTAQDVERIKREKIGPLETEYEFKETTLTMPENKAVMALIGPYLNGLYNFSVNRG